MTQMGQTLVVNRETIEEIFTLQDCIPLMGEILKDIAAGEGKMLQRTMINQENGNMLAQMMSSLPQHKIAGSKTIMFAGPAAQETTQGFVSLFDSDTGEVLAIVDARSITCLRTAATSAFATNVLARKDAKSLAIIGTGEQGGWHAKAICLVREIDTIYLWNRTPKKAEEFAEKWEIDPAIQIVLCETVEDAVEEADIVCTTTKGDEMVLEGEWLKEGTHLNAVGCCSAKGREVDVATLVRSRIFLDQTQACLQDAGDIINARRYDGYDFSQVAGQLGEVMSGRVEGRQSEEQITMFESVGIAVEDLISAYHIYLKAQEMGRGTYITLS